MLLLLLDLLVDVLTLVGQLHAGHRHLGGLLGRFLAGVSVSNGLLRVLFPDKVDGEGEVQGGHKLKRGQRKVRERESDCLGKSDRPFEPGFTLFFASRSFGTKLDFIRRTNEKLTRNVTESTQVTSSSAGL